MKNGLLRKKAERRWLKKAGFGKDMKDLGALAVELGRARGEVDGPGDGQAGLKSRAPRGGAAQRSLSDVCRECRSLRDECRTAHESVAFLRRMMRRDLVRLAWFAGGLSLVNFAVAAWLLLR